MPTETRDELPERAESELVAPHNWCDHRCERCVLAPECGVFLLSERARRREIVAGRDPESLDAVCAQVKEQLSASIEMLEAECRERGIDPASIQDWEWTAPGEELESLASEYVMAFLNLIDLLRRDPRLRRSIGLSPEGLDEISGHGYVIGAKLGRIASYLSEAGAVDGEVADIDGAPNLLLIQHLMDEVDAYLPLQRLSHRAGAYLAAREEVRRSAEPLVAAVPTSRREQLDQLVRLGRAPSPFCVTTRRRRTWRTER